MSSRTSLLKQAVKDRILVLDGAMGTMLQRYKLTEKDYPWRTICQLGFRPKGKS
jgi:methionine synthase I (cobalamin-dependent)